MMLPRRLERFAFRCSPARRTGVSARVNDYLAVGPLESGQVRVASPSVGPICSDSSASRPVPPSPGALHLCPQRDDPSVLRLAGRTNGSLRTSGG